MGALSWRSCLPTLAIPGTPLLMFGYLREGAAGVRVHAAQYRCVSPVDAYNDVHWNSSPINGRRDPVGVFNRPF
jgi:hypothetical protein